MLLCLVYSVYTLFHRQLFVAVAASCLGHPVRGHAGVVFVVTPGRPEEQGRRHHLQREGDEGEVEGPAQSALRTLGRRDELVEQIHPGQETAHGAQRAEAW